MNYNKPKQSAKKINGGNVKSIIRNVWQIDKVAMADRPFHFWAYCFCNIVNPLIVVG